MDTSDRTTDIDTVIIGAGQAGLSTGYVADRIADRSTGLARVAPGVPSAA